ncbi:MAG: ABC transporter permease [Chloroflexi bacterium]|nr:ABC transporter permease [Chloroflexota bacterium]
MFSPRLTRWGLLAILSGVFILLLSQMSWWETMLRLIFPKQGAVIYPRASLLVLTGEHMALVAISSALTILVAVPLGIWVTHPAGRNFLPIVNDLTSFGQTFPPVAVLALAVPMFGFGLVPTVIALFLYGLLPVVRNTIAGLKAVPASILEVAYGMGMSRTQTLLRVELPLAEPIILAGIRTSVIINVGTAMIGAVIGAGGLGSPIIAGLVQFNTAYVIEGALPAAFLAVLLDQLLANFEKSLTPASVRSEEQHA